MLESDKDNGTCFKDSEHRIELVKKCEIHALHELEEVSVAIQ